MDNTTQSTVATQPTPLSDTLVCTYAAAFIAYWEGYEGVAEWDVNAFRLGFGSDTEGPDQIKVTKGMATTRERALANLALRVPQYQTVCEKQLEAIWPKLGLATRVSCLDMAYNYGSIPASVVEAFLGNGEIVADAIRNHDKDNGGVNRDRRAAEAGLIILDGGQVQ